MLSRSDIAAGLRQLGLGAGDKVLLHSSLASLGAVDGGGRTVVDAFLEVLGEEGTLLVPVFGDLGVITHIVRNDPRAVISDCPKGTLAAIGKDAQALCHDHWQAETVHGEGTPYTRLAAAGGYVCLLGVDQDRNTTLHTVEALLRMPYLNETAARDFNTPQGRQSKTWAYYPGPHRDFIGLDAYLRESGVVHIGRIGKAVVRLMPSAELLRIGRLMGETDPAFCLCDNPNCEDCVRQRAAILKADFDREDFTLTVAASLAGYYVPEIVDNLGTAGVSALELDVLRGMPIQSLGVGTVANACAEFADAGVAVSSLRYATVPRNAGRLGELADACGVRRIVMPLGGDPAPLVREAEELGLELSFGNVVHGGGQAAAAMSALAATGLPARFTFIPANFAAAGEKPFLQVFHTGRFRKYIDQLDVVDGRFDGAITQLAAGNAEVKELVSILRCSGFGGFICLSRPNARVYETCLEAVKAFRQLLEEI